jgi:5'-nucleotidase
VPRFSPDPTNIALWDLDGSLADYEGVLLKDLKELQSPNEEDITDLWESAESPHITARIRLIKSQPKWWTRLPIIEMGFQLYLRAVKIGFRNLVLSKGPASLPAAWEQKVSWVHNHLRERTGVLITCDKSIVYGKFLYDDYPVYMDAWLSHRPRGLGIMPITPRNKDYKHPHVLRYEGETNIDEMEAALVAVFNRKPGEALQL